MPIKHWLTLSKSSFISAMIMSMVGVNSGYAEDFNTGYVLEKMQGREGTVHIDGVVRGIAYAHYYNNGKDQQGFDCINNYAAGGNNDAWQNMIDFLEMHKEKPLGGVMFIYLRKKCNL